jgi:metal-responsive CopG/Arc/MetJ family transcriptional regulator
VSPSTSLTERDCLEIVVVQGETEGSENPLKRFMQGKESDKLT